MYIPEWKGPIEGYVVNSLKREIWRIKRTHDHDDAMSEAYLVFLRCAGKYPIVDTPQHFMALFKSAWACQLIDLSKKATKANALIPESNLESDEGLQHEPVGELENAGHLLVMLRQAPREVLMVLNLFLNAPTELLDLAQKAWAKQGHRGSDGNAMIARLLGTDPKEDLVGKVVEYFGQDSR